MDEFISQLDTPVVAFVLGAVMFGAWEIGKLVGARRRKQGYTQPSKFADASMALLGLLIAFSFGMSIERHDRRRLAAVADSNSIGDFYTCASLVSEPTRSRLQAVVRQYAQLRLAVGRGEVDVETALAQSDQMHNEMTRLVDETLKNGTSIAVPITNTLNALISNQASRLAAFRDRLPTSIVALLFVGAIVSVMLIGREQGTTDTHDIAGTLCFILLTSIAVYVTLDLNRPESGLIRVSQEPIVRLLATMPK